MFLLYTKTHWLINIKEKEFDYKYKNYSVYADFYISIIDDKLLSCNNIEDSFDDSFILNNMKILIKELIL